MSTDDVMPPSDAELADGWLPSQQRLGPIVTCLADVTPKNVDWLWRDRIPMGRLSLMVGPPGLGKSFVTTCMAAHVTTGRRWPDGADCPMGSVILLTSEDDLGDTIRPRLDAHHADVRKVHHVSAVRRADEKCVTGRVKPARDGRVMPATFEERSFVR